MRNPSARPDILTGRPWLLAIGRLLGVEYPALEQPVPERLAALLKKLEGPSAVSPPTPDRPTRPFTSQARMSVGGRCRS
jgi:hypothetical protein